MWKYILDKWLLGALALIIFAVIVASFIGSRAEGSELTTDPETAQEEREDFRVKLAREEEEWNREFEAKLHSKRTIPEIETVDTIDPRHRRLAEGIKQLQPRVGDNRSIHLAKLIIEHTDFCKIPHENFIAAIINRESSFSKRVETGKRRGALGEIGLMQIMPNGYAIREFGNECEQTDAACNIMTGTRYLQDAREICKTEDPWIWMVAYASGKCSSPASARQHKSAKRARRYFCQITPDCETFWPQ